MRRYYGATDSWFGTFVVVLLFSIFFIQAMRGIIESLMAWNLKRKERSKRKDIENKVKKIHKD